MPYSNIRKVDYAELIEWEVAGEFHIDQYYPSFDYYILVEDDTGDRWVHEVVFHDEKESAQALATRIEYSGFINLTHWGFHDYFSLSLEQKLNAEAGMEALARNGHSDQIPDNGIWGDYQ